MNFGNPQRPEIMGQFVGCIEGMGEACLALDYPVVSGNVSLYNETNGKGILPTPVIGGVGLIDDVDEVGRRSPSSQPGEAIHPDRRDQGPSRPARSILREIHGREDGAPPPVDLAAERRNGDFVRDADPARPASPPATTSPTAACWSRSPRWRWPASSAPTVARARQGQRRRTPSGSARTRRATSSTVADAAAPISPQRGQGGRRAGDGASARPAAMR